MKEFAWKELDFESLENVLEHYLQPFLGHEVAFLEQDHSSMFVSQQLFEQQQPWIYCYGHVVSFFLTFLLRSQL